jgi:excinuclease ABC subunit C
MGGFIKGTRHFSFEEIMSTNDEAMGIFIRQYYEKTATLPNEILVSLDLQDGQLIEEWFKTVKGKRVKILNPKRGEKAKLLTMVRHNAEKELRELMATRTAEMELLLRLQKKLKLTILPERIECFDNSNISGAEPVAGMVVFEKGKAKKSAYRKFKIKAVPTHDDYAYMSEVLKRRLRKFTSQQNPQPFPDLLMVDGGRGQLNIALAAIKELSLEGQFELIASHWLRQRRGFASFPSADQGRGASFCHYISPQAPHQNDATIPTGHHSGCWQKKKSHSAKAFQKHQKNPGSRH